MLLSAGIGGVIGKEWSAKRKLEKTNINSESEYNGHSSILCLSRSSGIEFQNFFLPYKEVNKIKKRNIDVFEVMGVPSSRQVEGDSVVFLMATQFSSTNELIKNMKKEHSGEGKVIVIGGYVEHLIPQPTEGVQKGIMGVWFHGKDLSASLYIHSTTETGELTSGLNEMKEDIRRRKRGSVDWRKSIMLVVMCVERGEGCYGKPNVESDIVSKVFPGVPMFGFFGYGEIGFDSARMSELKKTKNDKKCRFAFAQTSVYCLLNFG